MISVQALKEVLRRHEKTRTVLFRLASGIERLAYGGLFRERLLVKLLRSYYSSKYRRDWVYAKTAPHFFQQRVGIFKFAFGDLAIGPYSFYRGFFASEIIRDGDRLLDIGCGDGFFTKRFYSPKCEHIDAIDVEVSAIKTALFWNRAVNITYGVRDAVQDSFPGAEYDVIVWDGALGHFGRSESVMVLEKIRKALKPTGVFMGSESLGLEGDDHLQYFGALDDLGSFFNPYFKCVQLREQRYKIGLSMTFERREAYWRCSNDTVRLAEAQWQGFSSKPFRPVDVCGIRAGSGPGE